MSCAACLDLLKFPVTLSCGHSICKPCVLAMHRSGSGISAVCPLCAVVTQWEREADMKVNAALQRSIDVLRGDIAAAVACSRCETVEATAECHECSAKFCSSCCDLIHVGKLKAHRLSYSDAAIASTSKPPHCEQSGHEEYRKDLYCCDCNILLCVICAQTSSTHRLHAIIPLKQAAEVEATKLRETLESAERFRSELRHVAKSIDETLRSTEGLVKSERDKFERSVNSLIEALTRAKDDVIGQLTKSHRDESLKLRRAKEQIVTLASKLNDSLSFCQRALATHSHVDIITGRVEMERQLALAPPIVVPQIKQPVIRFGGNDTILAAIDGITISYSSVGALPTAVLEASTIFTSRGFKFCKSTYNEIQLLNRGFSALSTGRTWETVMTDTLLNQGVHFFEVRIDRYDAANGHNIVIGLVFDGAVELCEVIGEDANAVGYNCGRGTKCVNGDFLVPYGPPSGAGDVIGLKLDFDTGSVEYFRNGTPLGPAFTGVSRPCYAAVSMINTQQVTLMFPSSMPAG